MIQAKFYWDSLAYYGLDSVSTALDWTNLFRHWRFRGYGVWPPTSWQYWFGLGRYTHYEWMYDSTGPSGGVTAYMRRNPRVWDEANWVRSGEPICISGGTGRTGTRMWGALYR